MFSFSQFQLQQQFSEMLEITVKTLDGRNRTFSVEDDITVKQFKETIASSIEISADVQRLIFRGKVLVDDKKINDYDVNGQTLHVVQRAPPQTNQSGASETGQGTSASGSRRNGFELPDGLPQGIHIEMIPEAGIVNGSGAAAHSESRKRIDQATRMLNMAKDVLTGLEQASSDNTPTAEKMETDEPSTSQEPGNVNQHQQSTEQQQQQQQEDEQTTDPPATALADLLLEVLIMNGRMEEHIRQYRDIMRNNNTESSQDAQSLEAVCQGASKAMHLMSHVYHNLSDLFCDFNAPGPRRLRAFSPPMRQATTIIQQTIPVQVSAQFNVSPVLRENATPTSSSPSASATSSTPPQATPTMASAAASTATTTTSSSAPSSASGFLPSSFFSELNRLVGGEIPNINFGSSGSTQSPQGLGRAFQMFMEMGPNGNINTSTSATPAADEAPHASTPTTTTSGSPSTASRPHAAGTSTTGTTATGNPSSETNSSGSNRSNVTTGSGVSGPGFLSDDFLQNIIQVATGVALQNGAAQRPHLVMLGPQLFMGSGQRGQASQRRRTARRANEGPAHGPEGGAGSSSFAGTPRSDQPRRFREVVADPCLPCNSWHFGHRAAAAPNAAPTASAEAATVGLQSAAGAGPNENVRRSGAESEASQSLNRDLHNLRQAMGTLQQLTSSLTRVAAGQNTPGRTQQSGQSSQSLESIIARVIESTQQGNTVESMLHALGSENVRGEGLLSDLISHLAPHITLVDMFNLVLGQSTPLTRLRLPLQSFVRDELLERHPPTDDNIATAVESILSSLQQDIREVSACVQAKEDIDFAASLKSFLRHHLTKNIKLILNATDDAFGEQLHMSLNVCLHELVNLCRFCLRDEDRAIETIIQNRIQSIYDDSNPMFRPLMAQWMTQLVQSKLPTIPRSQEGVLAHVVRGSASDPAEAEREADVESSGSFESASANALDEKMEEEEEAVTASPKMVNGQVSFESLVPSMDGHVPRLDKEVVARLPLPPSSDDFEVDVEKEADDMDSGWKSVVPKEWVPVIAKDGVRQRRQAMDQTREPLSDAYLCGVPAKRRKLMMKEKNHGQSNAQLNNLSDSIRQAANQVNCQPITSFQDVRADLETSHNLLSAYREELARAADVAEEGFERPGN